MAKKNEVAVGPDGLPDFSSFEKEQISFPPYWMPEVDKKIYFIPMMLDEKDPDFPRFVCKAQMSIDCLQGPSNQAEKVTVKPGEYFTLSQYSALPLQNYFGHAVLVTVTAKRSFKGDDGKPRTLWVFDLAVSADTKRLLEAKREEAAKALTTAS